MTKRADRVRCPFYGFRWPERSSDLTDAGGSQCGLDFDNNAQCAMETGGVRPDFNRCRIPLRTTALLEAGRRVIRFFPSELAPNPIPLEEWQGRVMTRRPERP